MWQGYCGDGVRVAEEWPGRIACSRAFSKKSALTLASASEAESTTTIERTIIPFNAHLSYEMEPGGPMRSPVSKQNKQSDCHLASFS